MHNKKTMKLTKNAQQGDNEIQQEHPTKKQQIIKRQQHLPTLQNTRRQESSLRAHNSTKKQRNSLAAHNKKSTNDKT